MSPLVLSFAFAILLNAFLSIGAMTIGTATSTTTADQDCNKFSVQNCTETSLPKAIYQKPVVSQEKCQEVCNEIFSDKCQFFIYLNTDKMCSIYGNELSLQEFLDTDCTTVGGFKSSEECSTDLCSTFIHRDCEPAGKPLKNGNIQNVDNEDRCRIACDVFEVEGCKYYLYNKGDQICTLYEEAELNTETLKNCKSLIGKKNANNPLIKNEMCDAYFEDIKTTPVPAACAN